MGKAKPYNKKDDKNKKKGFKKKSDQSTTKKSKLLKSLKSDQEQSPAPANKSLNSLKKIQLQLDKIVAARETENKQIQALKDNSKALSKQIEDTESRFSKLALNKDLKRIKKSLDKKSSQLNKETDKLSQEITLFKDLAHRVEHKIQTLETHILEKENNEEKLSSSSQLKSLNQKNELLFNKISYFEEELKQFSDTHINPEQAIEDFSEQLKLLSQTIVQLNESHQAHDDQIKQLQTDSGENKDSLQQLNNTISTMKENQQQLIKPLEIHFQTLEKNIQSLQQDIESLQLDSQSLQLNESPQQEIESPQLKIESPQQEIESPQQDINKKVNQFIEQLQQSQDELKQQIHILQESKHNTDIEEYKHFNETLDTLSQQLSDVTGQSHDLQSSFSIMQKQHDSEDEHHDELSKQCLNQQQQLEKHNVQLLQLIPVISQTEANEQQLEQISDSLEQLANTQNKLSHLGNDLQSDLLTLVKKVDNGHSQSQTNIDKLVNQQQKAESRQGDINSHQLDIESHQRKMVSYQQEQAVALNQLSEKIDKRSLLFGIGLISAVAISALLFFNPSEEDNDLARQNIAAQLKTDITNEAFTKINALTRQNSGIITEQFVQVRHSIDEIRKQSKLNQQANRQTSPEIDIQALKNTWQEQHQVLQEGLSKTQTDQQELNKTVTQLAETMTDVSSQFQLLQQSAAKNINISSQKKQAEIEITEIQKNTAPFYTIQLLGALDKNSILDFIKQHQLSDSTHIYQTRFQDKPWYILVQGHYSRFSQAKEKLQQLPAFLQQSGAWIKKIP